MTEDRDNQQHTEQALLQFIEEKSKITVPITEDMSFRDDLGLDSMDLTELIFLLEDLLGAPMDDSELHRLTTVRSALDFLRERGAAV